MTHGIEWAAGWAPYADANGVVVLGVTGGRLVFGLDGHHAPVGGGLPTGIVGLAVSVDGRFAAVSTDDGIFVLNVDSRRRTASVAWAVPHTSPTSTNAPPRPLAAAQTEFGREVLLAYGDSVECVFVSRAGLISRYRLEISGATAACRQGRRYLILARGKVLSVAGGRIGPERSLNGALHLDVGRRGQVAALRPGATLRVIRLVTGVLPELAERTVHQQAQGVAHLRGSSDGRPVFLAGDRLLEQSELRRRPQVTVDADGNEYDVFISYRSKYTILANTLKKLLEDAGLNVWFADQILTRADNEILAGIGTSRSFAILWGPDSADNHDPERSDNSFGDRLNQYSEVAEILGEIIESRDREMGKKVQKDGSIYFLDGVRPDGKDRVVPHLPRAEEEVDGQTIVDEVARHLQWYWARYPDPEDGSQSKSLEEYAQVLMDAKVRMLMSPRKRIR